MQIEVFQHVPFEGPAAIADWAARRGFPLRTHRLYEGAPVPVPDELAGPLLVVFMGGPMSVNDERPYPWLRLEKALISVLADSRPDCALLGVCLGAQLIASALGARVYPGQEKEIGWFPVEVTAAGQRDWDLPGELVPLHWHGETFDLPAGADVLVSTEVTPNQAFAVGHRVLGLQFHLEATRASTAGMTENLASEIGSGTWQQEPADIAAGAERHPPRNVVLLYGLLDRLIRGLDAAVAQA